MTDRVLPPEEEQNICRRCGICCDGTLFLFVTLKQEDRHRLHGHKGEGCRAGDSLLLPCSFFNGRCSIYDIRPTACSYYRCQLLVDFSSAKVTFTEAMKVIRGAKEMRSDLMNMYSFMVGKSYAGGFRKLLTDLRSLEEGVTNQVIKAEAVDLLQAKSNIFEALLIRHFISEARFSELIMKKATF